MKMMLYSCVLIVILGSFLCFVQGQSQCTTPTNRKGTCIPIKSCPRLLALDTNTKKSYKSTKLLRDSQCGTNKSPKVCCEIEPEQCFTHEGHEGTCINIKQCPYLENMLKPPVYSHNRNYVNSHRCDMTDEESVCCVDCNRLRGPPNPMTGCCGRDILGEKPNADTVVASIHQYPWMVALEEVDKKNVTSFRCGAVLISSRYVLTAAHCFWHHRKKLSLKKVRIGEYDKSADGPDCVGVGDKQECTDGAISVPIETVHIHPSFTGATKLYDIALLRLQNDVPYTDYIRPICLPMSDLERGDHTLYLVGFGAEVGKHLESTYKLHVDLPFVPSEECKINYEGTHLFSNGEGQICAGGVKDKGPCTGDAGGPLMSYNGFYELIGILNNNFGKGCGSENYPDIFSKVYYYLPWIRSLIKP